MLWGGGQILAVDYGFDVRANRIGTMGYIHVQGDSAGQVDTHEITVPPEWKTNVFYLAYCCVDHDPTKLVEVSFHEQKITITKHGDWQWIGSKYINVQFPVEFANSNL